MLVRGWNRIWNGFKDDNGTSNFLRNGLISLAFKGTFTHQDRPYGAGQHSVDLCYVRVSMIMDILDSQHPVFLGGHPFKYWTRLTYLNFSTVEVYRIGCQSIVNKTARSRLMWTGKVQGCNRQPAILVTDLWSVGSILTLSKTSKGIEFLPRDSRIVCMPGSRTTCLSVITHSFRTPRFAKS